MYSPVPVTAAVHVKNVGVQNIPWIRRGRGTFFLRFKLRTGLCARIFSEEETTGHIQVISRIWTNFRSYSFFSYNTVGIDRVFPQSLRCSLVRLNRPFLHAPRSKSSFSGTLYIWGDGGKITIVILVIIGLEIMCTGWPQYTVGWRHISSTIWFFLIFLFFNFVCFNSYWYHKSLCPDSGYFYFESCKDQVISWYKPRLARMEDIQVSFADNLCTDVHPVRTYSLRCASQLLGAIYPISNVKILTH